MMDARKRHKAQQRRERLQKRQTRKARAQNSMTGTSGAGGKGDRGTGYNAPRRNVSPLQHDRQMVEWWANDWSAKKIVNIPVEDMLREGWNYNGLPDEETKKLTTAADTLDLVPTLSQALRLERLLGGSVIFMGVADGADDPSTPIDVSTLDQGCLRFLNVIPRNRISKAEFESDPLSAGYGRPSVYTINAQRVHRSRLLIFDGQPLTPNGLGELNPRDTMVRNDGFGDSVLESIIQDLTNATGTRQGAFNLVNMASIWLLKMDVMDLEETEEGQGKLEELEKMAQQISMYRAAIMDSSEGNDLASVSPSFGSVPELVITFLQVLSAASDIPATRFIGQAPGGLNATGDSDLENYYNSIGSKQVQRLLPQLQKLLAVLGRSTFGPEFANASIDVEFEPLWNMSEVDESTVRTNDSTTLATLVGAGVISSTEAEAEARERKVLVATPALSEEYLDEGPAPNVDAALTRLQDPTADDILQQIDDQLISMRA